eukprot:COSAG02_NODE_8883_length_2410_cov_1.690177_1_plen_33_part_10
MNDAVTRAGEAQSTPTLKSSELLAATCASEASA